MFRYGLSWPQARALLVAGSYVRRERWTDKRLFLTAGGLVWVDGSPARVVRSADFGRTEFLAKDWTDMGFDQGDCVDHPGWTHISIDETDRWRAATPERSVPNPPSWAPLYSGGRIISPGRIVNYRSEGFFWVHPFLTMPAPNGQTNWYGRIIMVPVRELVTYTITPADPGTGNLLLSRTITNPFSAACQVEIAGSARDVLLLNGRAASLPASFQLASGASFTLTAKLLNPAAQPVAAMDLEVDLSL
jgi:hypothetical protein